MRQTINKSVNAINVKLEESRSLPPPPPPPHHSGKCREPAALCLLSLQRFPSLLSSHCPPHPVRKHYSKNWKIHRHIHIHIHIHTRILPFLVSFIYRARAQTQLCLETPLQSYVYNMPALCGSVCGWNTQSKANSLMNFLVGKEEI